MLLWSTLIRQYSQEKQCYLHLYLAPTTKPWRPYPWSKHTCKILLYLTGNSNENQCANLYEHFEFKSDSCERIFPLGYKFSLRPGQRLCARFCLCQWRVGDCQRLRRHRASAKRTSHWRGPRQGDWVLPNRAKWLASSWPPIATVCTPWGLPSKRQ